MVWSFIASGRSKGLCLRSGRITNVPAQTPRLPVGPPCRAAWARNPRGAESRLLFHALNEAHHVNSASPHCVSALLAATRTKKRLESTLLPCCPSPFPHASASGLPLPERRLTTTLVTVWSCEETTDCPVGALSHAEEAQSPRQSRPQRAARLWSKFSQVGRLGRCGVAQRGPRHKPDEHGNVQNGPAKYRPRVGAPTPAPARRSHGEVEEGLGGCDGAPKHCRG